jgi:D-alanyl-D-alanine carboxypeptidase
LKERRVSLQDRFPVSHYAATRQPTKLGLRPGQRVRLNDLILGLVTQSANDAAVVLAEGLAGSEQAFAAQMTRKARALGMKHSVFRNASGLPDPEQVSTARDMAVLAGALLHDFPKEYFYFSTRNFRYHGRTYVNHNHLLSKYPGVDGIKTGYTNASGYHLAASAKRNGRRVIAVVLGDRTWADRDRRMVALLDDAFDDLRTVGPTPGQRALRLARSAESVAKTLTPIATAEAAALPDLQLTAGDAGANGEAWAVQVGAYSRRDAAERVADRVMTLDDRLTDANRRVVVSSQGQPGSAVFLVQFGDFTRAEADGVCHTLKSRRQDCLVREEADASDTQATITP